MRTDGSRRRQENARDKDIPQLLRVSVACGKSLPLLLRQRGSRSAAPLNVRRSVLIDSRALVTVFHLCSCNNSKERGLLGLCAYSLRNISAGSCRDARRAGIAVASNAGNASIRADAISTNRDVDLTP